MHATHARPTAHTEAAAPRRVILGDLQSSRVIEFTLYFAWLEKKKLIGFHAAPYVEAAPGVEPPAIGPRLGLRASPSSLIQLGLSGRG